MNRYKEILILIQTQKSISFDSTLSLNTSLRVLFETAKIQIRKGIVCIQKKEIMKLEFLTSTNFKTALSILYSVKESLDVGGYGGLSVNLLVKQMFKSRCVPVLHFTLLYNDPPH